MFLASTWAKSHIKYNQKCMILSVFWTCIVSRRRVKQFIFFNCLSNVKNLVLSNGSKHMPIVIQWRQNR